MKFLVRSALDLLVRMHPQEFRREFGNEMLFIVRESMNNAGEPASLSVCVHLFSDLFRSAILQHFLREHSQSGSGRPLFVLITSSGLLVRTAEGAFLLIGCLCTAFNIVLFLYMVMRQLSPFGF